MPLCRRLSFHYLHKPLTFSFTEFSTDVHHIKRKCYVVADPLSCLFTNALPTIDFHQLAKNQADSGEVISYKTPTTGLCLVDVRYRDFTVLSGVSTGKDMQTHYSAESDKAHIPGHSWILSSRLQTDMMSYLFLFVWHSLKHDDHRWCQECYKCQALKIQRHLHTRLVKVPPPDRSFGSIHVDIIGSLPASENKTYPFTIVNHFTHAGQIKAITQFSQNGFCLCPS